MTRRQRSEPEPIPAPTGPGAKGLPASTSPMPPLTSDVIARRRLLAAAERRAFASATARSRASIDSSRNARSVVVSRSLVVDAHVS